MSGKNTNAIPITATPVIGMSSSWLATKGYNIKSAVEKIFGLGFKLVELGAAHKYEPKAVQITKLLKRQHPDKKFTIHTLFPPLEEFFMFNIADGKAFDKNIMVLKSLFQAGKIVDAEAIGIHGGYKKELEGGEQEFGFTKFGFENGKRIASGKARKNIERVLEVALSLAEKNEIKLCVETDAAGGEDGCMVKPADFEWLLSRFDSKFLGVLADIGHIHVSAKKFGFDEYKFVENIRDKIFEVHMHDCNTRGDSHITAGAGVIDFKKYFQAIGSRMRQIPLVFEYMNRVSIDEALKSREYVERMLKEI